MRASTVHGVFVAEQSAVWKKGPALKTIRKEFLKIADSFMKPVKRRLASGSLSQDEAEQLIERLVMRRLTQSYGVKMELIPWE